MPLGTTSGPTDLGAIATASCMTKVTVCCRMQALSGQGGGRHVDGGYQTSGQAQGTPGTMSGRVAALAGAVSFVLILISAMSTALVWAAGLFRALRRAEGGIPGLALAAFGGVVLPTCRAGSRRPRARRRRQRRRRNPCGRTHPTLRLNIQSIPRGAAGELPGSRLMADKRASSSERPHEQATLAMAPQRRPATLSIRADR
jgi:hypothetical protein